MSIKKIWAASAALAALATAAGCGSSPGEADIHEALIKQAEAAGARMAAPGYKEVIAKSKVAGCVKADAGGYACDVSNATGAVMNVRLVKTDLGWSIVN